MQKCPFQIQKCLFQIHNIITFTLRLITFTLEGNLALYSSILPLNFLFEIAVLRYTLRLIIFNSYPNTVWTWFGILSSLLELWPFMDMAMFPFFDLALPLFRCFLRPCICSYVYSFMYLLQTRETSVLVVCKLVRASALSIRQGHNANFQQSWCCYITCWLDGCIHWGFISRCWSICRYMTSNNTSFDQSCENWCKIFRMKWYQIF